MIKKIEDWNYYELLDVERTASQREIWEAYQAALTTYQPDSLAAYGLVTEDESGLIMKRIQEAYQTLRDPETRRAYDLALLERSPYIPPKAPFRKSVGKVEIEEAPSRRGLWAKIRHALARGKRAEG
jgi:curved DNA-binding protein CbpA